MGVPIVLHHVADQPHTSSPHFASFPYGLLDYRFMVLFFLPASPHDHEPSISSTISFPICEPIFISPTSYRNSPVGPPPFIYFLRNFCPPWGTRFTLGHPFLYLYIFPILFIIYCTNTFIFGHYIFFCHHRWQLASFFWPHATHVTLGWSIASHFPLPASFISSEHYTGHLPLPSEFVHLVPPLAQLITRLVVPLTLDLVTRLRPLFQLIHPPTKGSLESSHFLTSSIHLCHFLPLVDSMKPFASGSHVPLLSTAAHFF
jgi:hypothetical protein